MIELESEEFQKQFKLYALCQPHTVVVSDDQYHLAEASRIPSSERRRHSSNMVVFDMASLPSIPFMQQRLENYLILPLELLLICATGTKICTATGGWQSVGSALGWQGLQNLPM